MNMGNRFILILLLISSFACTGKKGAENASASEQMKFEQYIVEGQQLYELHCSNCHQSNGGGLAKLYPALAKSDYLMDSTKNLACIINKGLEGKIVVNGIEYNQPMPAIPSLTKLEIAEILTYVKNSWGNKGGSVSIKEVEKQLKECE